MAKYSRVKQSGDIPTLASTADLPLTGLRNGETVFANGSFFVSNGSGWYRITLVNEAPSITLSAESISLGAAANTAYIGFTTVEPEGTPVTVSIANNTANSTQANVNLYTSNNTLVVENLSGTAYDATITLTVSDGVNLGTDSLTVNVAFVDELWDETLLSVGTSSTSGATNSTFIDRSTNAHTVTPSGSPVQTAFHPYLDNWSVEFDGGSNYYTLPTDAVTNLSTGTIEFWVNVPDIGEQAICAKQIDGVGTECAVTITNYVNSGGSEATGTSGRIYFHPRNGLGGSGSAVNNTSIEPNIWYHVAICWTTSQVEFFLNGVSDGTSSGDYSVPDTQSQPLKVAYWGQATQKMDFTGNLSDFMVSNVVKYTDNFTPEKLTADVNTIVHLAQTNRHQDLSSNEHIITAVGTPKISAFNPFGQGSEYTVGENKGSTYFDGTNDYASVSDDTTFRFGTSDFTIEFWMYPETISGTMGLVAKRSTGITDYWRVLIVNGNLNFRAAISNVATTSYPEISVYANQWAHIVFTRESGILTLYYNGVAVDTGTESRNLDLPNEDFRLGALENGQYKYTGYLSDIRIVKGTAKYTSDFTPPTSPVGNTDASLYFPMDNAGIFDKTGQNTLTPVGNASTSTTQTKFADTAMYFDGSEGGLDTSFIPTFGTSSFTIEGWIYPTVDGDYETIVSFDDGVSTGVDLWVAYPRPGTPLRLKANGTFTDGNHPVAINSWYHFALVRNGIQSSVFLNGTLTLTANTGDWNVDGTGFRVGIGFISDSYPFNGYIENLQILKGVAKYTANFTPPTQTQGRTYQEVS